LAGKYEFSFICINNKKCAATRAATEIMGINKIYMWLSNCDDWNLQFHFVFVFIFVFKKSICWVNEKNSGKWNWNCIVIENEWILVLYHFISFINKYRSCLHLMPRLTIKLNTYILAMYRWVALDILRDHFPIFFTFNFFISIYFHPCKCMH